MLHLKRKSALFLLFAFPTVAAGPPAAALNLTELYTTRTIVTGTGEKNRQPGLRACFASVLIKVSGDPRIVEEETVVAALPQVTEFLASYRYRDRLEGRPVHDEQGTHDRPHDLTCVFDREKVDRFLRAIGRSPWLAERPRLIVFLTVRQAGKAFLLARDGPEGSYMKESLASAGEPLDLTFELPDAATLAAAGLTPDSLTMAEPAELAAIAQRYGGAQALAGSLEWSDKERGWIAEWQLSADGEAAGWQARGVSFDDAFRHAAAGSLQVLSGNGRPH